MKNMVFAYDRLGRMTSATTTVSTNLFDYSGFDLVTETQNGVTITRTHDSLGRSTGFNMGSAYIAAYGYDTFGRFAAVSSSVDTASYVANYSYVAGADLVASVTNSAGFWRWVAYEQDRDTIASVENGFGSGTVSSFEYENDAEGMRVLRVDSGAVTNTFRRNVRGELTGSEMGAVPYGAEYDSIGNRIWSAVGSETNLYAANSLNQYTQVSGGMSVSPVYDADGNMLRDGTHWHTWDAENRLIRSEPIRGATNGAVMVEYSHNHRNLRVAKIKKQLSGRGAGYPLDPSQAGTWDTVETRRYVWDGYNIAAEFIIDHVTSSTNISYFTWGLDLSETLQGAGGVGGLLAETKMTASNTNTYYAFGDANGNVTEYADATGAVRGHYGYAPFGKITAQNGDMAGNFTHRFSTKPFDVETGLVMYELRPYEPDLGRWLCRDPIEEEGGLNLYGMLSNQPLENVDNLGLSMHFNIHAFFNKLLTAINKAKTAIREAKDCLRMLNHWRKGGDEQNTDDKYRHCLASCEINQSCGSAIARATGYMKEAFDLFRGYTQVSADYWLPVNIAVELDVLLQGGDFQDSVEDFTANEIGIKCAKSPDGCSKCCCDVYVP